MTFYTFKKLFEIRILHEYYLSKPDNSEYFALSDQERADILSLKLANHKYDIWKSLKIEPSEKTSKLMDGHRIKFVPTETGFIAGVEVNKKDGNYVPTIPWSDDMKLSFTLNPIDPHFRNFTNLRIKPHIKSIFYFSNMNPESNKVFPSLSVPVHVFQSGKYYEMGQLAKVSNKVKEALVRTKSGAAAKWHILNGVGLSNENDRIAVLGNFLYQFDEETIETKSDFILKTTGGDEVKKINVESSGRIDTALLDFMETDDEVDISDGMYDLEVVGDGGYSYTHRIYINNELANPGLFGIVEIEKNGGDPDFALFDPLGNIKTPHPIYEIRLKSRITYWRYKSNDGSSLATTDKTLPFLKEFQGALSSKKPRLFTLSPSEFLSDNPATPVNERIYLPNPHIPSVKPENDGKVYSDIYVSKIKDLIDVS